MDWAVLAAVTLAASLIVGLVAYGVARRIAGAEGELGAGVILLAIVISLVVLQGAAKLAVLVVWIYERVGIDPATAADGQLRTTLFAASFLPIAAYVVTFLLVFKKAKGAAP